MAEGKDNGSDINLETLLRKAKANAARKLLAGETGLASELDKIHELEQKIELEKARSKGDAPRPDDTGIPERHRIKRPYTMSEAARLARQNNARKSTGPRTREGKKRSSANGRMGNWKHGAYSGNVIARTFGLCEKKCGKYPCPAVERGETKPRDLCLDYEGLPVKIKTLVEAAATGEIKDVKELQAVLLAMQMQSVEHMLMNVAQDGHLLIEDVFNGFGQKIGVKYKNHPHLAVINDALHKLGVNFAAMRMTPQELEKSKDAEDAGKALSDLFSAASQALSRASKGDGDGAG